MKTTDYQRAKKAVQQRWTGRRAEKELPDKSYIMYEKLVIRAKNKFDLIFETKKLNKQLITNRLEKVANAMPAEGYSMGGLYEVKFHSFSAAKDTREQYSGRKWRPTWGGYTVELTLDEMRNIQIIGGVITYIYPGQRQKCKKCWWYEGRGSKQFFELQKVEGYIYNGFHSTVKSWAIAGGKRNEKVAKEKRLREKKAAAEQVAWLKKYNKAARQQYSFQDSIAAGNCEVGTRAFILRCGLDETKMYRGAFLIKIANEKSTSSVSFVKKMIAYKAK
ncbi:MAG: hypothetical protein WC389_22225 [Lutibacter sp.]|jgi:hypothetical protein